MNNYNDKIVRVFKLPLLLLLVSAGSVHASNYFGFDVGNQSYNSVVKQLTKSKIKYTYSVMFKHFSTLLVNQSVVPIKVGTLTHMRLHFFPRKNDGRNIRVGKLSALVIKIGGNNVYSKCKKLLTYKYGSGTLSGPDPAGNFHYRWQTRHINIGLLKSHSSEKCWLFYISKIVDKKISRMRKN